MLVIGIHVGNQIPTVGFTEIGRAAWASQSDVEGTRVALSGQPTRAVGQSDARD